MHGFGDTHRGKAAAVTLQRRQCEVLARIAQAVLRVLCKACWLLLLLLLLLWLLMLP